jgi:hypothetical protein
MLPLKYTKYSYNRTEISGFEYLKRDKRHEEKKKTSRPYNDDYCCVVFFDDQKRRGEREAECEDGGLQRVFTSQNYIQMKAASRR